MGSRRDSRWLLGWVGFRWSLSRNRSLSWPLESVSYRNHIAKIAADASDAAAPCTWMHHGTVAPQQAHRPRSGGTEVCLFGRCQVATQVERTVEHAEDFDVTLRGDQVGDPIVAIQEHADFWPLAIAIADLRETSAGSRLAHGWRGRCGARPLRCPRRCSRRCPAASRLASAVQTTCATTRESAASPRG